MNGEKAMREAMNLYRETKAILDAARGKVKPKRKPTKWGVEA
jgi:exonuclease VII small subunit